MGYKKNMNFYGVIANMVLLVLCVIAFVSGLLFGNYMSIEVRVFCTFWCGYIGFFEFLNLILNLSSLEKE